MLFPYNTDAPIYHFPYGTIGLIVVNTLVFFTTMFGIATQEEFESLKWLCLEFDRINPFQWLSNIFMHADIMHLLGNMLFLWAFGLLVEGKLGLRKFLDTYLILGILSSAFTQILMFSLFRSPQCALGASGVIYALMGIALVWAPKNDMHCFLWLGIFSRVIDLPVLAVCGFYFGLQVLFFWLGGFRMSSEALHLTGLAFGFPCGVFMLKRNWVDCEGWDLFNVMLGNEQEASREALAKRQLAIAAEGESEPRQTIEQRRLEARNLLRRAIVEKQPRFVVILFQKHNLLFASGQHLNSQELTGVVSAMHELELWSESIPLMRQVIEREPKLATSFRLRLAQILIQKDERPRQAIAVLKQLPLSLPETQDTRRKQILALAQRQINRGVMEVDLEAW